MLEYTRFLIIVALGAAIALSCGAETYAAHLGPFEAV